MMFEGAVEKGHITKRSLKNWVVDVYKASPWNRSSKRRLEPVCLFSYSMRKGI
jgi:hypothetical protein